MALIHTPALDQGQWATIYLYNEKPIYITLKYLKQLALTLHF